MNRIITVILFFLAGYNLYSQTPKVEANVSKNTVEQGEVFSYTISTNQECEVIPPDFGDIDVVGGPSYFESTSSTYINGVAKTEKTFSYTWQLRINKKGAFTIGAASMKCKLKKVSTGESITIKVVEAGSQDNSGSSNANSNYFFKLISDKSSVYVGEPFVITFKYYSTKKPNQIEEIMQGNASGIWRGDLNPNRTSFNMTQENVKGVRYYVLELSSEVCFAERPGKLTIDPYSASLTYAIDFFNSGREEGRSNSLLIDVKKLPGSVPVDFNGLVGRFNLNAAVDKKQVMQGDAIELKLTFNGSGNLLSFDEPKINLPETFSISGPESEESLQTTSSGIKGEIVYTYILTPLEHGDFEIEPFSFSYFDIGENQYKQISTGKISIHVDKADASKRDVIKVQKPIETENTDIHFIHENKGRTFTSKDFLFGSLNYWTLIISPPIIVLMIAFMRRRKNTITEEEKTANAQKSARKSAGKNLKNAISKLKSGEEKEALKMLQSALVNYLMIKLNLSLSSLSIKSITAELESKKAKTENILELNTIWKKIEMAQYAPVSAANLEELIKDTLKLIDELDAQI